LDIQLKQMVTLFGGNFSLRLGDGIIHCRRYCEAFGVFARLLITLLLLR
jgi:hypothetical protein